MLADKYQKINLKNKIVAALVAFGLILFALIYFIVIPTIKDIKTMSQEIEEQRIDLEKKYIKGNSLKQLAENLKKIEPKLSSLDQIFISKNRELEFITTVENEANKNRVGQKINLSSPKATENLEFQKNNLQLFTKGEFNKQLKYLLSLESLGYYINVKSIELTPTASADKAETGGQEPSAAAGPTTNLNMFINADTYWK